VIKVRILAGLAGTPYQPGQELTLPVDEARQLIAQERAEAIGDVKNARSRTRATEN